MIILVNNAGVGATAPLLNADVEKMDAMIRLNVGALAAVNLSRHAFHGDWNYTIAPRRNSK
jgi:short-subunit dehydrogenase